MKRILIVGNSGGGESTLARKLGEKLGLPVIHLDVLFWKPGWVESDDADFRIAVTDALQTSEWLCDGNFGNTWDIRMPLADTIIWIDQPRLRCLMRAIWRIIVYRRGDRPDMAKGCHESLDLKFYHFIWTYNARVRPRLEAALATHGARADVVHLRSDREIANFLACLDRAAR